MAKDFHNFAKVTIFCQIGSHWFQIRDNCSVTSKKSQNVQKSCAKINSLQKISTPLQKLPNNVDNLGKIIVATVFKKLPKVQ